MRFSLQDVKKAIQRRGNDLSVSLHFLRPGELHAEIERLIVYYEALLGCKQSQFSQDDARSCIGDYRLAHCLMATLSNWYSWRQREWNGVLGELATSSLPEDITSSVQLRLALYSYVNERYQGFLDMQTRAAALQALAESYQLSVVELESLLVLDSEEEACLTRSSAHPPTVEEVATLYNQWAFEAALFNASNVHFVIDCNAFGKSDQHELSAITGGAGMVIKRLCYLARKLGVYYDLAYDEQAGLSTTQDMLAHLHLTLYGPQEVTGVAQQYGLRLARLCRLLMGYGIAKGERAKKAPRATLSAAIIEADAKVHFLQRVYSFRMDAQMLQLLPAAKGVEQIDHNSDGAGLFDSSIEQSFSEAFSALAGSQGVDGWRLEREPEPLLLASSIFIPDFALTRARRRIYVEILGFWTPAYRERKIQKLQQLQMRNDLLLAIPIEAKGAFAAIAAYFPIIYYDGQLSVTEVLQVLRTHYDDLAERLELIDVADVRERVMREGLLPERLCYELLHAYRRSELQQGARLVIDEDVLFMPGVGLYTADWLKRLKSAFMQWMLVVQTAALGQVLREARERWPILAACEDAAIEALLGCWPEVQVRRNSIFEAVVEVVERLEAEQEEIAEDEEIVTVKAVKRSSRRVATKKRNAIEQEATQGDLWG